MNHYNSGGKLAGKNLQGAIFYEMKGSSPLEQNIYEQYLILKYGGVTTGPGSALLNINNPMGGRMATYWMEWENVIIKYGLPR